MRYNIVMTEQNQDKSPARSFLSALGGFIKDPKRRTAIDKHNTEFGNPTDPIKSPGDPKYPHGARAPHLEVGGYDPLPTQKPHGMRHGVGDNVAGKQTLITLIRMAAKHFGIDAPSFVDMAGQTPLGGERESKSPMSHAEIIKIAEARFHDLQGLMEAMATFGRGGGQNQLVDDPRAIELVKKHLKISAPKSPALPKPANGPNPAKVAKPTAAVERGMRAAKERAAAKTRAFEERSARAAARPRPTGSKRLPKGQTGSTANPPPTPPPTPTPNPPTPNPPTPTRHVPVTAVPKLTDSNGRPWRELRTEQDGETVTTLYSNDTPGIPRGRQLVEVITHPDKETLVGAPSTVSGPQPGQHAFVKPENLAQALGDWSYGSSVKDMTNSLGEAPSAPDTSHAPGTPGPNWAQHARVVEAPKSDTQKLIDEIMDPAYQAAAEKLIAEDMAQAKASTPAVEPSNAKPPKLSVVQGGNKPTDTGLHESHSLDEQIKNVSDNIDTLTEQARELNKQTSADYLESRAVLLDGDGVVPLEMRQRHKKAQDAAIFVSNSISHLSVLLGALKAEKGARSAAQDTHNEQGIRTIGNSEFDNQRAAARKVIIDLAEANLKASQFKHEMEALMARAVDYLSNNLPDNTRVDVYGGGASLTQRDPQDSRILVSSTDVGDLLNGTQVEGVNVPDLMQSQYRQIKAQQDYYTDKIRQMNNSLDEFGDGVKGLGTSDMSRRAFERGQRRRDMGFLRLPTTAPQINPVNSPRQHVGNRGEIGGANLRVIEGGQSSKEQFVTPRFSKDPTIIEALYQDLKRTKSIRDTKINRELKAKYPFLNFIPSPRGAVMSVNTDGVLNIHPKYFSADEEFKRHAMFHEAGHGLADAIMRNMEDNKWAFEPDAFKASVGNQLVYSGYTDRVHEHIAEMFGSFASGDKSRIEVYLDLFPDTVRNFMSAADNYGFAMPVETRTMVSKFLKENPDLHNTGFDDPLDKVKFISARSPENQKEVSKLQNEFNFLLKRLPILFDEASSAGNDHSKYGDLMVEHSNLEYRMRSIRGRLFNLLGYEEVNGLGAVDEYRGPVRTMPDTGGLSTQEANRIKFSLNDLDASEWAAFGDLSGTDKARVMAQLAQGVPFSDIKL